MWRLYLEKARGNKRFVEEEHWKTDRIMDKKVEKFLISVGGSEYASDTDTDDSDTDSDDTDEAE